SWAPCSPRPRSATSSSRRPAPSPTGSGSRSLPGRCSTGELPCREMFDLRYHVASLAAVFVALVLGIFVGVGLSGKGFVSDAERENLQAQIDALRSERDSAAAQAAGADRRGVELDDFAKTTYPQLVSGMLEGKNVGVVFIGSVDQGLANTVRRS